MFPMLMTEFCMPAGRPCLSTSPIILVSNVSFRKSSLMSSSSLHMWIMHSAMLTPWENTVAAAAPMTPQRNTATKTRSSATFSTEENAR